MRDSEPEPERLYDAIDEYICFWISRFSASDDVLPNATVPALLEQSNRPHLRTSPHPRNTASLTPTTYHAYCTAAPINDDRAVKKMQREFHWRMPPHKTCMSISSQSRTLQYPHHYSNSHIGEDARQQ
jgi:hypothetical protein